MTPLIVKTLSGDYTIEVGHAPGTFAHAREATLIAKAYEQLGDYANALKWQREYSKRLRVWEHAEAGGDIQAIIDQLGGLLLAPLQIIYDVASGIVRTIDRGAGAVIGAVEWAPWLVFAGLGVLALGLHKGTLRGSFTR